MPRTPPPEWLIVLRPEPGPVPPEHRIRQLLKRALRDHGLRCVSVGDPTPDQLAAFAAATAGAGARTPAPTPPPEAPA